jgi:hypothetical protein
MEAVHFYSRGIPRVINLLCENALISAYVEHIKPVPARMVEEAARDFLLDESHAFTTRSSLMIEALADVMLFRGIPENIRSDNGPEFVAKELRQWLAKLGTGTLYIEPGRLLRKLQREVAGRVLERRDFLFVEGGTDRNRKVAGAVQYASPVGLGPKQISQPGAVM